MARSDSNSTIPAYARECQETISDVIAAGNWHIEIRRLRHIPGIKYENATFLSDLIDLQKLAKRWMGQFFLCTNGSVWRVSGMDAASVKRRLGALQRGGYVEVRIYKRLRWLKILWENILPALQQADEALQNKLASSGEFDPSDAEDNRVGAYTPQLASENNRGGAILSPTSGENAPPPISSLADGAKTPDLQYPTPPTPENAPVDPSGNIPDIRGGANSPQRWGEKGLKNNEVGAYTPASNTLSEKDSEKHSAPPPPDDTSGINSPSGISDEEYQAMYARLGEWDRQAREAMRVKKEAEAEASRIAALPKPPWVPHTPRNPPTPSRHLYRLPEEVGYRRVPIYTSFQDLSLLRDVVLTPADFPDPRDWEWFDLGGGVRGQTPAGLPDRGAKGIWNEGLIRDVRWPLRRLPDCARRDIWPPELLEHAGASEPALRNPGAKEPHTGAQPSPPDGFFGEEAITPATPEDMRRATKLRDHARRKGWDPQKLANSAEDMGRLRRSLARRGIPEGELDLVIDAYITSDVNKPSIRGAANLTKFYDWVRQAAGLGQSVSEVSFHARRLARNAPRDAWGVSWNDLPGITQRTMDAATAFLVRLKALQPKPHLEKFRNTILLETGEPWQWAGKWLTILHENLEKWVGDSRPTVDYLVWKPRHRWYADWLRNLSLDSSGATSKFEEFQSLYLNGPDNKTG